MKEVLIALVTPFNEDLSIDYVALKELIEDLLKQGCNGFVVCGTTGEAPTLLESEKFELLEFVIDCCKGKAKIYFGCGTNDTMETIRLCKKTEKYKIDGLLLVTPYYNKPTQEGLYLHFKKIAEACSLPIMLYQVEGRCGCGFEVETLKRLKEQCPNIQSIKLASNNILFAKRIITEIPTLKLYCGVDEYIKEYDEIGACGVVSVIGHIAFEKIISFYKNKESMVDEELKRISSLLFLETNPIGIKYILSKKYCLKNILRLPLTSMSNDNKEILDTFFYK